ncbi:hypothetical protein THRCLA_09881 [Thraustotheca clavata]|uniref:Uncharacterized protein n=1 Tax=Thraustotheca clavata TaxID=74557 RepID=A0A1V9YTP3_9STRA|nr:hypothetical protein THRCLA_09881 [Thraustotheca clavata]
MLLHGRQPPPVSDEEIPRHDSAPHGLSLSHRLSTLTRGISSSSSTARLSGLFRSQRVMPVVRQSHDGPSPAVLDTEVKPLCRVLTLRDRVTQFKLHRKSRQSFDRQGWRSTSGLLDKPTKSKRNKSAVMRMPTFNLGRRQSLIRRTEEMQAHQEMISVFNLRQTKRPSFHRSMSQRAQLNFHRWFFQTFHPNSIILKLWRSIIITVIIY